MAASPLLATDRRRSFRMPAAYQLALHDRRGLLITRGRTANISETGVLAIVSLRRQLPVGSRVLLDMLVPSASLSRRDEFRRVVYRCRVARIQSIGQLTGLGLEFIEKVQ